MLRKDSLDIQIAMKEGKRFYQMLMNYLDGKMYSSQTPVRILNVGCGQCLEGYALIDYFGKEPYGTTYERVKLGTKNEKVELIGIDLTSDLRTAKEVNRNSEFLRMDAKTMEKYLNCIFDVVITRHPNVCHDTDNWKKIYEKILFLLNSDGILIITNYNQREFDKSLEIIEQLKYKVKVKEKNHYYGVALTPGINYDDWIIIAEKA